MRYNLAEADTEDHRIAGGCHCVYSGAICGVSQKARPAAQPGGRGAHEPAGQLWRRRQAPPQMTRLTPSRWLSRVFSMT